MIQNDKRRPARNAAANITALNDTTERGDQRCEPCIGTDTRPTMLRTFTAMMLARDLGTCAALLRGEPVSPELLDQGELFNARRRTLVQMVAPIDMLLGDEAA